VANVPDMGKVRVVPAVAVRAIGKAPEVEKASAKLTSCQQPGLMYRACSNGIALIEVASAAPKVGVIRVGELLKTSNPPPALPTSSFMTVANCAEDVEANCPRLSIRSLMYQLWVR